MLNQCRIALSADVAELVASPDDLHPAERFVDPFAYPLRHRVAGTWGASPFDRRSERRLLNTFWATCEVKSRAAKSLVSKFLSPATVRRHLRPGSRSSVLSAVARSAHPSARVSSASTINAQRCSLDQHVPGTTAQRGGGVVQPAIQPGRHVDRRVLGVVAAHLAVPADFGVATCQRPRRRT